MKVYEIYRQINIVVKLSYKIRMACKKEEESRYVNVMSIAPLVTAVQH